MNPLETFTKFVLNYREHATHEMSPWGHALEFSICIFSSRKGRFVGSKQNHWDHVPSGTFCKQLHGLFKNISFIVFDSKCFKKRFVFLYKCLLTVMLFLLLNVSNYPW